MPLKVKDIAKMLGVSSATVSMVLNNRTGISEERRKQVIDKIKELNCEHLLKNINDAKKNIGFVVYKRHGDIIGESPFFTLLIQSVSSRLRTLNFNLIFIHLDVDNYKNQIEEIKNTDCYGLIIFAAEAFYEDLEIFKNIGLPFVILDNNFIEEDCDTVCINNQSGVYKSVKYLYELGHRKIGYIKSKTVITSFTERINTFYKVMANLSLKVFESGIFSLRYSEIGAYEDMKSILSKNKLIPTALIADNDLLAYAAMCAIQESGYNVPKDVSIIGFDDRPICVNTSPKMTTISVPKDIFGIAAVDLLVNKIEKGSQYYRLKIEVGTDLIIRESTALAN